MGNLKSRISKLGATDEGYRIFVRKSIIGYKTRKEAEESLKADPFDGKNPEIEKSDNGLYEIVYDDYYIDIPKRKYI